MFKQYSKSYLRIVILILVLVSFVFPYKKVKVFVLVPPELLLTEVKQIAVLDFEGQYGKVFIDRLVTELLKENRGITKVSKGFFQGREEGQTFQEGTFTNIFGVVERGKLGKIIDEQVLSTTGLIDETQAVQIGKLAGVQAILSGAVSYTHDTKDGTAEQTTKQGKKIIPTRTRSVDVTYKLKVLDVSTGMILGSIERSTGVEDKKYGDDIKNLFDVASGVDACITKLSNDAANYLTPRYVLEEYELQKIDESQFKKIGEEAAKKAEDYDIDGAFLLYKSLYDKDPYNHKLLYNLGILNEVVGNFKNAQEFYNQALQLKNKEKDYQKAVERIKKSVDFADVLAQLGIEIKEHSFEFSEADQQEALAQKIEIKGKDTERINVYKTAENGSEIIAKVPGGTTFSVMSIEGEFFKIKLLGGNEGYVHRTTVKMK